jgi:hypothetical protein
MFLPSAELLASFPLMFPALQSSSQVPTSAFYLIKLANNFILLRFEFLFLVSRIRSWNVVESGYVNTIAGVTP